MWRCGFIGLALAICGWALSGCGLVRAPFRVAGAVVGHGYQTGKTVANKTSKLFERDTPDPKPAKSGDATAGNGKPSPAAKAAAEPTPADSTPGKSGSADAGVLPPPPIDLPPLPDEPPLRPEDLPPP